MCQLYIKLYNFKELALDRLFRYSFMFYKYLATMDTFRSFHLLSLLILVFTFSASAFALNMPRLEPYREQCSMNPKQYLQYPTLNISKHTITTKNWTTSTIGLIATPLLNKDMWSTIGIGVEQMQGHQYLRTLVQNFPWMRNFQILDFSVIMPPGLRLSKYT